MEDNGIIFKKEQAIATLILNRPEKRNAFDDKTLVKLIQLLSQIQADASIRVVVLRGQGPHFCAGADISWMKRAADFSFDENRRDAEKLAEALQQLYHCEKPVIALISGAVYGGGLGLVACADIVLADPNTQFCFSEVKLGLVPAVVGPYVMVTMGMRAATRYMLTADVFDVTVAQRFNLIQDIVPTEQQEKALAVYSQSICSTAPHASREAKKMIRHFTAHPGDPIHFAAYTTELIASLRSGSEAKEGFTAFLNKQKPSWQQNKGLHPA